MTTDQFFYSLGDVGDILPLWMYIWITFIRRRAVRDHLKRRYGAHSAQNYPAEFEQLLTLNAVGATSMGLIVGSTLEVFFAEKHILLLLFGLYGCVCLVLATQAGSAIEARIKRTA